MENRVKIVATLGPSCDTEQIIRKMVEAGLDVVRLNFSHGTHSGHAAEIQIIRRLSRELARPLTILQDLQGPKIRVGDLPEGSVQLVPGRSVILTSEPDKNQGRGSEDKPLIPMDFPGLAKIVRPGTQILLDDGQLELKVVQTGDDWVEAQVVIGGQLKSHKGVNLPGVIIPIPGFTPKDREDLAFGLEQGVDAVAISFVHSAADIEAVRQAIQELAPDQRPPLVIAKLELPEAIDNLESILEISDGVMVARGDLGVEMSPARVPIAQKTIIEGATRYGKLVITATQMLESMIHNPRPTRAEASDVANAVFDGTDAVMLSAETAVGKYPIEAVATMDAIITQAETHFGEWGHCEGTTRDDMGEDAIALTFAARELAHDRNVAAIAVFTQTGNTARLMSMARPIVTIMAFTPDEATYHRMGLYWGVIPFLVPYSKTMEELIAHVETALVTLTPVQPGQQVVMVCGFPVGQVRPPNFALLHTVGDLNSRPLSA